MIVYSFLADKNIKLIACRCAGYNNIDINKAKKLEITVVNVPKYSPHAVAEHAMALTLAIHRKIPIAYERVKNHNFSLDGLMSTDLNGKTVGIIGSGNIGLIYAKICHGIGLKILYYSRREKEEFKKIGAKFTSLDDLCKQSNIISLHIPLNEFTKHIINEEKINKMEQKPIIINTSRAGLIDTEALKYAMKKNIISGLGMDVYDNESELFFKNLENNIINDDNLAILLSFKGVIITSHIGFFTVEALTAIYQTTINNINKFFEQGPCENIVN